jgi:hypothetical protein
MGRLDESQREFGAIDQAHLSTDEAAMIAGRESGSCAIARGHQDLLHAAVQSDSRSPAGNRIAGESRGLVVELSRIYKPHPLHPSLNANQDERTLTE